MTLGLMLALRVVVALHGPGAVADDPIGKLFTRVRSTDRFMIALVREGYDRSATFRELVERLQASNITVFVLPGYCSGGRFRACLVSVSGSDRARHIRIKVDPHTTNDRLIATVAHELQHAVEIAEHLEVLDASSALALYRRISVGRCRQGLSDECETARALETERTVLAELSSGEASGRPQSFSPIRRPSARLEGEAGVTAGRVFVRRRADRS
jgi:hypothetical protein